jgi:hypothetical protein
MSTNETGVKRGKLDELTRSSYRADAPITGPSSSSPMFGLCKDALKSMKSFVGRKYASVVDDNDLDIKLDMGDINMRNFIKTCGSHEKYRLSQMQQDIVLAALESNLVHFFGREAWKVLKPIVLKKYGLKENREVCMVQAPRQVGKTTVEALIAISLAINAVSKAPSHFLIVVLALNKEGSIRFVDLCKSVLDTMHIPDFDIIYMVEKIIFINKKNPKDRRIIQALATGPVSF